MERTTIGQQDALRLVSPSTRRRYKRNARLRVGIDLIDLEAQARELEREPEEAQFDMGINALAAVDGTQDVPRSVASHPLNTEDSYLSGFSASAELLPNHVDHFEREVEAHPLHDGPSNSSVSFVDDLYNMELALLTHILSFTLSGRNLRFVNEPSSAGPFVRYVIGSQDAYNIGFAALQPSVAANLQFLSYHSWLLSMHDSLKDPPVDAPHSAVQMQARLRAKLVDEIERLEDMKEMQWEQQQRKPLSSDPEDESGIVNTGSIVLVLLCL